MQRIFSLLYGNASMRNWKFIRLFDKQTLLWNQPGNSCEN